MSTTSDYVSAGIGAAALLLTAILALLGYVVNAYLSRKTAIFQGRVTRVTAQISRLYGPALVRLQAENNAWAQLRKRHVERLGVRIDKGDPFFIALKRWEEEQGPQASGAPATKIWTSAEVVEALNFIKHDVLLHSRTIFQPLLQPLVDIITANTCLIFDEDGVPAHLEKFIARVQAIKGVLNECDARKGYSLEYYKEQLQVYLTDVPTTTYIYFKVYHFMLRTFRSYLLSNQGIFSTPYHDAKACEYVRRRATENIDELCLNLPQDMNEKDVKTEALKHIKEFAEALVPPRVGKSNVELFCTKMGCGGSRARCRTRLT